jgi:transcriptional regulator with XRE-family HTH domain
MPAKMTVMLKDVVSRVDAIGEQIRARRKALRVSVTAASSAAGMSRVTWHRIEKGESSVTLGAFLSALNVLDLNFKVETSSESEAMGKGDQTVCGYIPVRISLAEYPQLKQLAWHVHGVDSLSPREALSIYERNWRHLDLEAMEEKERCLVEALHQVFDGKQGDV